MPTKRRCISLSGTRYTQLSAHCAREEIALSRYIDRLLEEKLGGAGAVDPIIGPPAVSDLARKTAKSGLHDGNATTYSEKDPAYQRERAKIAQAKQERKFEHHPWQMKDSAPLERVTRPDLASKLMAADPSRVGAPVEPGAAKLTAGEIAMRLRSPRSQVVAALEGLKTTGLVVSMGEGRWSATGKSGKRLPPTIAGITDRVLTMLLANAKPVTAVTGMPPRVIVPRSTDRTPRDGRAF